MQDRKSELQAAIQKDQAYVNSIDRTALENTRAARQKIRDDVSTRWAEAVAKEKALRTKDLEGTATAAEQKELPRVAAVARDLAASLDLATENLTGTENQILELDAAAGRVNAAEAAIAEIEQAELAAQRKALLQAEIKRHSDVVDSIQAEMATAAKAVDHALAGLTVALWRAGAITAPEPDEALQYLSDFDRRREYGQRARQVVAVTPDQQPDPTSKRRRNFARRLAGMLQANAAKIESHLVAGMSLEKALATVVPDYVKFMARAADLMKGFDDPSADPYALYRQLLQRDIQAYATANNVDAWEADRRVRAAAEAPVLAACGK